MPEDLSPNPEHEPVEFTQEAAKKLNDQLAEHGFSIWGHGTPASNNTPSSFFENGIDVKGSYTEINQTALPLGIPAGDTPATGSIVDLDFMRNWPHNRGDITESPNVVLFAVPQPTDEVSPRQVLTGLLEPYPESDSKEGKRITPELVVGVYDPRTGKLTPNPTFRLDEGSHNAWLERAAATSQWQTAVRSATDILGGNQSGQQHLPAEVPAPPPTRSSTDQVW